ncbi:putative conserved polyketide synthase associated protein PapA2 [Rhodococcoides trifolii]|uniref:Conserved polyketide synthase associated protein PapA2 n=1 Tax=Rhodococcoides trifolii TaxID=908250 RepID=A0A917G6L1_9NOCA|nr:condensation domain-containing protein [Rhodococcus trifolii]GGG24420.1 putative conserved polyketide synthase associated protein PapA2 [Rhodococcus trifolii]
MVEFGLIDKWAPATGALTTWTPTAASRVAAASAPVHPVRPSHIQQAYLDAAYRNRGSSFRFSRLCLVTFRIEGPLDLSAMTSAINSFVTRHDSFLSWFSTGAEGSVRHLVAADDVELQATAYGVPASTADIRRHVQETTPGPERWDCYSFGTIEHDDHFVVYAAIDHLDTDGISQALTFYELRQLYINAASGVDGELFTPGSYLEYCERERAESDTTTLESPAVQKWIDLVVDNGGDLPTFPLPLGRASDGYTRTSHSSFPLFDGAGAQAVDDACAAVGAKFIGGIFAAAAIAEYELAGRISYLGLTPKSTRATAGEFASIGWYSTLIPISIELGTEPTFLKLAARAQQAFDTGKLLANTSYHRVLELIGPEQGITTQPGWSAPMISYVDVRRLPGEADLDGAHAGLFGNRGSSEEVFMWINRFDNHTGAEFLYPGTDEADRSIDLYFSKISEILGDVIAFGDYFVPDVPAIPMMSHLPGVSRI